MNKKIIKSIFLIFSAIFLAISSSGAYFFDYETSKGNYFSAGTWGNLVINEVYFNLTPEHGREGKNEWIELYNRGNELINLKNYKIVSTMGEFPITANNIVVPAKGFALISHDYQTWIIWEISTDIPTVNLPGNYAKDDWLLAGRDCLYLKSPSGETEDNICWGDDIPAGYSYSRITPGSFDGWQAQIPTPGY